MQYSINGQIIKALYSLYGWAKEEDRCPACKLIGDWPVRHDPDFDCPVRAVEELVEEQCDSNKSMAS